MLKPYRFHRASIQRIQTFVNFLFLEIMCRAPKLDEASFLPSMATPRYERLLCSVRADYLLQPLQRIYTICRTLPPQALKILRRAVHTNNRIRELCRGELHPVLYDDLQAINPQLADQIRLFCDNLYDRVLTLAPFEHEFGSVGTYYRRLVERDSTCRFCGLGSVHNRFTTKRSDLDHYLPKSRYPFVSVNFHNLVPVCTICNKDYKGRHYLLFREELRGRKIVRAERVKAFYPFRYETPSIQLSFSLREPYSLDLQPPHIDLRIECTDSPEETRTWVRTYGIEERYKAYCCSDEMMGYVENQFIALRQGALSQEEYRAALNRDPRNFIRVPFLQAVEEIYHHDRAAKDEALPAPADR